MNSKGDVAIDAQYRNAKEFSENKAVVEIAGKYGFIDVNNNIIIDAVYDRADSFSGGYSHCCWNSCHCYIDWQGKRLITHTYMDSYDVCEGYIPVTMSFDDNGLIDMEGK